LICQKARRRKLNVKKCKKGDYMKPPGTKYKIDDMVWIRMFENQAIKKYRIFGITIQIKGNNNIITSYDIVKYDYSEHNPVNTVGRYVFLNVYEDRLFPTKKEAK